MRSIDNLNEISDGKVYDTNDIVYADTAGCDNCSACCQGVGDLVALNPFDVHEMVSCLGVSFDALLQDRIELRPQGKTALPYLKMQELTERCSFLNDNDRCTIHLHRPDICRLFPLGRVYEEDDFKYFLQTDACIKPELSAIKVEDWIGIQDSTENKRFILAWYKLLKALTFRLKFVRDEAELSEIKAFVIDTFYRLDTNAGDDFYTTFFSVLPAAKSRLGIL